MVASDLPAAADEARRATPLSRLAGMAIQSPCRSSQTSSPIAAGCVGIFVELSTLFIPADLKYAAALLILILVLLVRPQGILGRRERVG